MSRDLTTIEGYGSRDAELDDARRRFILSLRAMVLRREKDEREARMVQGWMDELQRHVATVRKWETRRKRRRMFLGAAIAVVVLLSLSGKLHGPFGWWWWFGAWGAAKVTSDVTEARKKQEELATALARARDPRAVSALAIACRDGDDETRRVAAQGLTSILPQLKASDAHLVTSDGMDALLRLLERMPSLDLGLAILKGLEQVGDSRAIPVVQAVERNPWWPDVAWRAQDAGERVRAAATECLRFLNARREQEKMRQVLLRPAHTPIEPSQTLLRPAANAESEEALLLRAANEG